MATQFQKQIDDLIPPLRRADLARRYQMLRAAEAVLKAEMEAVKASVLKNNDQRFLIVEDSVRETAPSKAQYIAIHGREAFEANKAVTPVRRHVKGLR